MTDDVYEDLVASQHQLDVLNMDLPLVFLCGPPGTGKTVLLVVRATDWLRRGSGKSQVESAVKCLEEAASQGDGDSGTSTHPPPLTFRDVFVLSWNTSLYDEDTDSTGNEVRPACGIVRGLRKSGIPVRVLCLEDEDALREVATMSGRDAVVAAGPACVRGLERKIVVWMQTERTGMGDESWGRLHALSRSTAQMIRIIWPPGQSRVSPV
nr:hypothetical protein BaRGS_016193 [Batillaria attramentaria]